MGLLSTLAGGGLMGEVQTDSPAFVKVRAATYTPQIPLGGPMALGFRACLEILAVRERDSERGWQTAALLVVVTHQARREGYELTLCSGS